MTELAKRYAPDLARVALMGVAAALEAGAEWARQAATGQPRR
jgi:hypothetical protein